MKRSLMVSTIMMAVGCMDEGMVEDGGADLAGADEKGDAVPGIEVQARLRPGAVDGRLSTAVPRPGYVFYAAEGTKVTLEVTQAGTQAGLDTQLKVYGPRLADGSYPKTIGADEDAGYGRLSKIKELPIAIGGFYLVEMTTGAAAAAPVADARARLKLSCTGTCDSTSPVAPLGLDVRWYQRAAERRALAAQTYAAASAKVAAKVAAGAPASWGVVLDIDETILDNSPYQRARGELGLGYSPASWTAWVDQRAARPLDGALAFTQKVRQLGGKVVLVSNRMGVTECPQTEDNLRAVGVPYDAILCRPPGTPSEKNTRFEQVRTGTGTGLPALTVLAYVGDNIQDFPSLTQDVRTQPEAAFGAFGETLFVLPNPMYGSWEKNLD